MLRSRIMAMDPGVVSWSDELVTHKTDIEDGAFVLSTRPDWRTEVNEDAVRAHPPKKRP